MKNIIASIFSKNEDARSITRIDPSLKKDDAKKLRAAIALNMCTASVSEIIAKNNLVAMESEYNNILNNINMESCVKDEALLRVMRKLLDTISFFRLNEMERKRLEKRKERKAAASIMGQLLSGGNIIIAGGLNPIAMATTAAVVGASMYANKKREDAKEQEKFEDKMWELERSAIEQIHALRVELFETAWRLADAYGFKDEWRLTEKQIEWFNDARSENDPVIRYEKLNQRQRDFSVYPLYWYELGNAATEVSQIAHGEGEEDALKSAEYLREAKDCFGKYIEADMHLLRQDYFAADARLKYICLVHEEKKSWASALMQDGDKMLPVRRLALDNPELLLKASMIYASAYVELREKKADDLAEKEADALGEWYKQATACLEMLVIGGSSLPVSSLLLTSLQKIAEDARGYERIAKLKEALRNDRMLLVDYDSNAETDVKKLIQDQMKGDAGKSTASLKTLFVRAFGMILQLADPAFNVVEDEQRKVLSRWAIDTKDFVAGMQQLWQLLKGEMNSFFIFVGREFSSESGSDDKLVELAKSLNDAFVKEMEVPVESKADAKASAVVRIFDRVRREFVTRMTALISELATEEADGVSVDDFSGALSFYIDSICSRKNILGINKDSRAYDACSRNYFEGLSTTDDQEDESDSWEPTLFGVDRAYLQDGLLFEYNKINHADSIEKLVSNKLTYTITFHSAPNFAERCRLVEEVTNLLRVSYKDSNASFRDLRSSKACGGLWRKSANFLTRMGKKVYNVTSSVDFIISVYNDRIEVDYQRVSENESLMPVSMLSSRALGREMKRLMNSNCTPGTVEYERLAQAFVRTMNDQFAPMIEEYEKALPKMNDKQKEKARIKLVKRFGKATDKVCKLGNSSHIWMARSSIASLLQDVQNGKLQLGVRERNVLDDSSLTEMKGLLEKTPDGSKS